MHKGVRVRCGILQHTGNYIYIFCQHIFGKPAQSRFRVVGFAHMRHFPGLFGVQARPNVGFYNNTGGLLGYELSFEKIHQ